MRRHLLRAVFQGLVQPRSIAAPAALALIAALACEASEALADERTILSGSCQAGSYVAKGPLGSDLGKTRAPYVCSDAIVVTFDSNSRSLVQFVEKGSSADLILGFAGVFDTSGRKFMVDRVYFKPTQAKAASDGVCVFAPLPIHGTTIQCVAIVDEKDRRTIAAVNFGGE